MKVLQINATNAIGSTGRTTKEIDEYLKKTGNESIIAYADGPECDNGYIIGTKIERKIHAFLSRALGLQGYFSVIGTKRLLKFIDNEKPDIIRLGNLHSNFINIKSLFNYLIKNNIPTIITLDDCFFYTGKCCHYTSDECRKWIIGCNSCIRLEKDNPSWLFDRTNKIWNDKKNFYSNMNILGVVGVSQWITNEAKISIMASAKVIETIYNWIDIEVFKPSEVSDFRSNLNLDNKFIILGVASEWSSLKGLDKFIEIAELLNEHEVIILVGKIDNKIVLPNNIIHIDETNDLNELVKYYSMADVFLQLSIEESFGKVTAEALSCGTPVIVYNSTANPELVGKRCGYIVEKNSIKDILDKIETIKKNTKEYYSQYCRDFSITKFNKDDRIAEYIKLFEKMINYKGEI